MAQPSSERDVLSRCWVRGDSSDCLPLWQAQRAARADAVMVIMVSMKRQSFGWRPWTPTTKGGPDMSSDSLRLPEEGVLKVSREVSSSCNLSISSPRLQRRGGASRDTAEPMARVGSSDGAHT